MPVAKGTPRGQLGPVRLCEIEGCGQRHVALGLCQRHYKAQYARKYYHKNAAYRQKTLERLKTPEAVAKQKAYEALPEAKKLKYTASVARRYGLTREQFYALWDSQEGKCKICNKVLIFDKTDKSDPDAKPHVDHCHATGKVRGILCRGCNRGLGGFKDSISNLESAIRYLGR